MAYQLPRSDRRDYVTVAGPPPRGDKPEKRRSLNVKLFVATLVVLALAIPAIDYWHRYEIRNLVDGLLTTAKEAEEKEDWRTAARLLSQYVELRPDDGDATARLASAIDKGATSGRERLRALPVYAKALELKPDLVDVRARSAELQLMTSEKSALASAEEILQKTPNHPAALGVKAKALARINEKTPVEQRKTMDVIQAHEEAVAKDPGNIETVGRLASLYRDRAADLEKTLGKPAAEWHAKADELIDQLARTRPKDVKTLLLRDRYRRRFSLPTRPDKQQPALSEDLAAALQLAPDRLDVRLAVADEIVAAALSEPLPSSEPGMRRLDRNAAALADEHLSAAIKIAPKDLRAYLARSWLLWELGNREGSVDVLLAASRVAGPFDPQVAARLAASQMILGRWSDAQAALDDLQVATARLQEKEQTLGSIETYRVLWTILRSQWLLGDGNPQRDLVEAEQLLSSVPINKLPPDLSATLLEQIGRCRMSMGQWELASKSFELLLRTRQDIPRVYLSAAIAAMRSNRWDAAVGHFQSLLDNPKLQLTPAVRAQVWQDLLRTRWSQQLRRPPADRDWKAFDQELARFKREQPESAPSALIEAEGMIAKGSDQVDGALRLLERGRATYSKDPVFLNGAFQIYFRLGRLDLARQVLTVLTPQLPKPPIDKHLQLAGAEGRFDLVEKALDDPNLKPADVSPELFATQADLALRAGRPRDARAILTKLDKRQFASVAHQLQLAQLAFRFMDLETLRSLETRLSADKRNRPAALACRSLRFVLEARRVPVGSTEQQNLFIQSDKAAEELQGLRGDWPLSHFIRGLTLEARGQFPPAITAYERALQSSDRSVEVARRLLTLCLLSGDLARGQRWLTQLPEGMTASADLMSVAVAILKSSGQSAAARALVEKGTENNRSLDVLLTRGQFFGFDEEGRDPERAEKDFQHAVQRHPNSVVASVGQSLDAVLANQADTAMNVAVSLSRLRALLDVYPSENGRLALIVATALQLSGDYKQADAAWRFLQERGALEQEPLADQVPRWAIVSQQWASSDLPPSLADWDRWPDAAKKGLAAFVQAGLLPASRESATAEKDRRIVAAAQVSQGGVVNPRQALEAFRSLPAADVRRGDRWLIARLHMMLGDSAAGAAYQALLRGFASPPQLLEAANYFLARGERAESEAAIEALRRATKANVPWDLQARLFALQGKQREAIDVALAAARGESAATSATSPFARELAAAELLTRLNAKDDAFKLIDVSAKRGDKWARLGKAGWLGRQPGMQKQALNELIALQVELPVPAASSILDLVGRQLELRSDPAFTSFLAGILANEERKMKLASSLVAYFELAGDVEQALALARAAHERSPESAVDANNLAFLLSAYQKDHAAALSLLNDAIRRAGPDPGLLDTKGSVLFASGKALEGAALAQATLLVDHKQGVYWLHLAESYAALNAKSEAKGALAEAVRLGLDRGSRRDLAALAKLQQSFAKP